LNVHSKHFAKSEVITKKYKKYLIYSNMLLILSSLNAAQEKLETKLDFESFPKKLEDVTVPIYPPPYFPNQTQGPRLPRSSLPGHQQATVDFRTAQIVQVDTENLP
jgi:hypothetical protein